MKQIERLKRVFDDERQQLKAQIQRLHEQMDQSDHSNHGDSRWEWSKEERYQRQIDELQTINKQLAEDKLQVSLFL